MNILEKNIEKKCSICSKSMLFDISGNGECPHCGWYNSIADGENEDYVMFPNVVSENKARKLYAEGKPFRPSLEDFLDMLYFYGEVSFQYGQLDCELSFEGDTIVFGWSPESVTYYKDRQDFIDNAKIGNEYVRDIWDQVENPSYI